jgi:hypothetical protein
MKIGVTGNRTGMNESQFNEVQAYLVDNFVTGAELHHGDCVGVDVEVASLAADIGYKIVCHPPLKSELRGNFPADETRELKSYFARNRDIVDETEMLLVVPYQNSHQSTGGTWYTHDYAKKLNKDLLIFYPGEVAPKCCVCETTVGLHKDSFYGYRCSSIDCMVL